MYSHDSIYEMLSGITELKLNQFEDFKIKEWEIIQKRLFTINLQLLRIDQIQFAGFEFLNQFKNIIVTFLASTYVVKGSMTLGMLLSISYIIGQMNSPVNQFLEFIRSLQDARLSLDRLNEIQDLPTEDSVDNISVSDQRDSNINDIKNGIFLSKVSFQYEGPNSAFVLKDIDLLIPDGKVTAIVGASGSGKTTLMKLLLRFYDPVKGEIYFNKKHIFDLSHRSIRENTGIVMQDGYIFSDTILRNIITKDVEVNVERLKRAVKVSRMDEFIESLPLKYNTIIGAAGNGLSGGQRQRLLIARAVYKNPHYIFLDEATSSLDAENEKLVHENLQEFFKGKTVVIIAHRLSTVRNADKIVVLRNGVLVEQGTHIELVEKKSDYYNLVKNQLDLGV